MAATIDPSVKVKPSKSMLGFLEGLEDRDDVPKALRNAGPQSELGVADVRWIFDNRVVIQLIPGNLVYDLDEQNGHPVER